jgi:HORMA domain-containing protein
MASSFSVTEATTFTVTHARHMAAKVATDLKRLQRMYGAPSDTNIADYEAEIVELVKAGYLDKVTYGYRRDGAWIVPTLRYTAQELAGATANDDDPGRIRPGADTTNATFYSYLTYSTSWDRLTSEQQAAFKQTLPFIRGGAPEPGVNGYFSPDLVYSAGGRALNRGSVRSW